jgi:hypothetical protein
MCCKLPFFFVAFGQGIANCLLDPRVFACDATRVDPSNVTCLTASAASFPTPPTPPLPRPCPDLLRGLTLPSEQYEWLELGPVSVMKRSDPQMPPLELEWLPDKSSGTCSQHTRGEAGGSDVC